MVSNFIDPKVSEFNEHGFLIIKELFSREEAAQILKTALDDELLEGAAYSRTDASGKETMMTVWDELSDDIYSIAMRTRRVTDIVKMLIGNEICHYNSKLNAKAPNVGGSWEWHQDYGYAYDYGVLRPAMATCFLALDPSNQENGCIEIMQGSHKLGRINHTFIGKQYCADPDRINIAEEKLAVVPCELEPGDAVFFHCNTLHRSGPNLSDKRRWALITVFNLTDNLPFKDGPHSGFHPIAVVEDDAILSGKYVGSSATKESQKKAYNPAKV